MPTTITPVSTNGAQNLVLARKNGEEEPITIDNDAFADGKDFLIEKRDIPSLVLQIQNTGSSNGLAFEIYGSIDPASTAPAFALKSWELTENGSGNLSSLTNKIFETSSYYIWILIRLKRQTASLDTTAEILTTSGRR